MNRRKLFPILAVAALAGAAVFGAFTYQQVGAQATTPTPGAGDGAAQALPSERGPFGRGIGGGMLEQDLADALGISVEELEAAEVTARDNALAQAVEQGLITQAQADAIKAGERLGGLRGLLRGVDSSAIDQNALLAEALGISEAELDEARQAAASAAIDRAVENGVMTQEQADLMKARQALRSDAGYQASMQSAFEAAVAQAVSSGVITQAQADAILANADGKWDAGGRHGRGGLDGFFGGRGGRHGGFPGLPFPGITAPDEVPAGDL